MDKGVICSSAQLGPISEGQDLGAQRHGEPRDVPKASEHRGLPQKQDQPTYFPQLRHTGVLVDSVTVTLVSGWLVSKVLPQITKYRSEPNKYKFRYARAPKAPNIQERQATSSDLGQSPRSPRLFQVECYIVGFNYR